MIRDRSFARSVVSCLALAAPVISLPPLVAAITPTAEAAEPSRQVDLPALGDVSKWLILGQSSGWDHRVEGNTYSLSNTENSGAVRYFSAPLPHGAMKVKVTTTFKLDADKASIAGAGLIYGYDGRTQNYVAVTIQANNSVATYVRDGQLREAMRSSAQNLIKPGTNELTILGTGNTIAVLVNGEPVGTLTNALLTTTKGAGILALGKGTFTFESYSAVAVQ